MNVIDRFYNGKEHTPLSNFYQSTISCSFFGFAGDYENCILDFPTVEHYYQAAKCMYPNDMMDIKNAYSPGIAKQMGRKVQIRDDWEEIKLDVMRFALERKFKQNWELARYLWETEDAYLIEGNNWGDTFWGMIKAGSDLKNPLSKYNYGKNWLGLLLMNERAVLRAKYPQSFPLVSDEGL